MDKFTIGTVALLGALGVGLMLTWLAAAFLFVVSNLLKALAPFLSLG